MDIRQLRYYVAILEAGSFSRGAERLGVAQPALSQHVLAMEAQLGVSLLHRSPRGVTPTTEGLRLLDQARDILARFEGLQDHVRGGEARPRGEVRFGMPGTVSEQVGVPLVEAVQSRFPDIDLRVSEAMSGFVLSWLREGKLDLALLFDVADARGLVRHDLMIEDIVLFAVPGISGAPARETVTLQAALRLPLILPSPSHGLRTLIDACALSIGARVRPSIEIDSYNQINRLVARGSAYAMLPAVAVMNELSAGEVKAWRLTRPAVRRHIFLAYRADSSLSAASRAVAGLVWDILGNRAKSGQWPGQWVAGDRPFEGL